MVPAVGKICSMGMAANSLFKYISYSSGGKFSYSCLLLLMPSNDFRHLSTRRCDSIPHHNELRFTSASFRVVHSAFFAKSLNFLKADPFVLLLVATSTADTALYKPNASASITDARRSLALPCEGASAFKSSSFRSQEVPDHVS